MVAENRYLTSSLDKFTNFATKEDFRSNNSEHLLVFSRVNYILYLPCSQQTLMI